MGQESPVSSSAASDTPRAGTSQDGERAAGILNKAAGAAALRPIITGCPLERMGWILFWPSLSRQTKGAISRQVFILPEPRRRPIVPSSLAVTCKPPSDDETAKKLEYDRRELSQF